MIRQISTKFSIYMQIDFCGQEVHDLLHLLCVI